MSGQFNGFTQADIRKVATKVAANQKDSRKSIEKIKQRCKIESIYYSIF